MDGDRSTTETDPEIRHGLVDGDGSTTETDPGIRQRLGLMEATTEADPVIRPGFMEGDRPITEAGDRPTTEAGPVTSKPRRKLTLQQKRLARIQQSLGCGCEKELLCKGRGSPKTPYIRARVQKFVGVPISEVATGRLSYPDNEQRSRVYTPRDLVYDVGHGYFEHPRYTQWLQRVLLWYVQVPLEPATAKRALEVVLDTYPH